MRVFYSILHHLNIKKFKFKEFDLSCEETILQNYLNT